MPDHSSLPLSSTKPADDAVRITKHFGLRSPDTLQAQTLAQDLSQLFRAEQQNPGAAALLVNHRISAGYTYLGQFITHDIGMVRNLGLQQPALALLSLYGPGPGAMPFLYVHYKDHLQNNAMDCAYALNQVDAYDRFRHAKLRLIHECNDQYDVPRSDDEVAMMADTRNDQNFILNQIHCAFARFHNALVEWLQFVSHSCKSFKAPGTAEISGESLFILARELAVYYYRRLILEDYLPKMAGQTLVNQLLAGNFKLFNPASTPRLMPEFRQAAMRCGHSMVREIYMMNSRERREIIFDLNFKKNSRSSHLGGFNNHERFGFEWQMFFDTNANMTAQPSAAINHQVAYPLSQLPFLQRAKNNLIALNIEHSDELPFGIDLAVAAGFAPLTQPQVDQVFDGYANVPKVENLPLWPYILLEAEIQQNGQQLGELGGHIVAEQIMWVLGNDRAKSAADLSKRLFEQYPKLEACMFSEKVLQTALETIGFGVEQPASMVNLLGIPDLVADNIRKVAGEMKPEDSNEAKPRLDIAPNSLLNIIRSTAIAKIKASKPPTA